MRGLTNYYFYSIMAPESFFHTALLNSRLHLYQQLTKIGMRPSHKVKIATILRIIITIIIKMKSQTHDTVKTFEISTQIKEQLLLDQPKGVPKKWMSEVILTYSMRVRNMFSFTYKKLDVYLIYWDTLCSWVVWI